MLSEREDESAVAHRVFNSYQANFVRCLDYAQDVAGQTFQLLDYLDSLGLLFIGISAPDSYVRELKKRPHIRFNEKKMQQGLDVSILSARYYGGEFASAFSDLEDLLSLDELNNLDADDSVDWLTIANASDIYCIEGYALEVSKLFAKINYAPADYPHPLFQIGEFNKKLLDRSFKDFFTLETSNAMGILSIKVLDDYLSTLYTKAHLERTQTMYLRAKMTNLSKLAIKKLIVTNPYTAGLKSLMFAFAETDLDRKFEYFEEARSHLKHVKYYYVECLYFFAKFLQEIGNSTKFRETYDQAVEMAEKHSYRYLKYKIEGLISGQQVPYSSKDFPLKDGTVFDSYINYTVQRYY